VGGLTDPDMLEEIIASGKADIVQMGRQTLADPDFPLKARTGNEDAINRCLRCFTCFATSMVGGIFYCATNPVIGHERDALNESPPRFKRRVLIAGGGIAGMQAALTAAERGHEVIICEKDAELGGILKCERHVPFKEKINSYIERQILRISRMSNVDIRLNTKVTKSYAKSLEADVIIAALGASPAVPPIKGIDGDNVFSAEKVYKDPLKAGKAAVIIGGGLVGVELGIFLGKLGAKVTVVEMLPETIATMKTENISKMITDPGKLNFGDNVYHGIAIREQINKLPDMKVLVSTKVVEITPDGIVVNNTDGEYMIKADSVIYAIGMKAREIEAWDLSDCAKEFYQIGDCLESSNIVNATQAAYQIARDIGRF
jgi:NADPH-dependent 2,4-dienoyl-CoA reductase/sulfur reductase-like enzyme